MGTRRYHLRASTNPNLILGSAYGVGSPTNPSLHCPHRGGRTVRSAGPHAGDFPGRGGPAKRGLCAGIGGPVCGPWRAFYGPCWASGDCAPTALVLSCHRAASVAQLRSLPGFLVRLLTLAGAGLPCLFCRILSGTNAGLEDSHIVGGLLPCPYYD